MFRIQLISREQYEIHTIVYQISKAAEADHFQPKTCIQSILIEEAIFRITCNKFRKTVVKGSKYSKFRVLSGTLKFQNNFNDTIRIVERVDKAQLNCHWSKSQSTNSIYSFANHFPATQVINLRVRHEQIFMAATVVVTRILVS